MRKVNPWSQKSYLLKAEVKRLRPNTLFHIVYICFIGFMSLYIYRPMRELDFFWRIILGDSLISNSEIASNNLSTWGDYDNVWKTTQPMGEILLSRIYKLGGLELISVSRIIVWIFFVCWVYRLLFTQKGFQKVSMYMQFMITIYGLTSVFLLLPFIQERPQTILLILLAIVGSNLAEVFMNSVANVKTSTWLILAVSVWVHPAWVIIYSLAFFHIAKCAFERKKKKLREYVLLLVIPVLPILGPSGANYYLNLIEISRLGRLFISEWQPLWKMNLSQPILFLFGIQLVLIILLSFGLAKTLSSTEHILFLAFLFLLQIFAAVSLRNLPIAIILSISWLGVVIVFNNKRTDEFENLNLENTVQKVSNIENVPNIFKAIPLFFLLFSLSISIGHSFKATEDFTKVAPIKIIESMSKLRIAKVINSSNEGGYLHYFGGVTVFPFIDGRIDRYNISQIDSLDSLFSSETGTKDLKRKEFNQATEILIPRDKPFRPVPKSGFRFVCQENGYLWFSRQSDASCSKSSGDTTRIRLNKHK